jgi:hypothetical protein
MIRMSVVEITRNQRDHQRSVYAMVIPRAWVLYVTKSDVPWSSYTPCASRLLRGFVWRSLPATIPQEWWVVKLAALKADDIIEYPDAKTVRLMKHGIKMRPNVNPPRDNAKCTSTPPDDSKAEARLFRHQQQVGSALRSAHHGQVHKRKTVALAIGYQNIKAGGFVKVMALMRSSG